MLKTEIIKAMAKANGGTAPTDNDSALEAFILESLDKHTDPEEIVPFKAILEREIQQDKRSGFKSMTVRLSEAFGSEDKFVFVAIERTFVTGSLDDNWQLFFCVYDVKNNKLLPNVCGIGGQNNKEITWESYLEFSSPKIKGRLNKAKKSDLAAFQSFWESNCASCELPMPSLDKDERGNWAEIWGRSIPKITQTYNQILFPDVLLHGDPMTVIGESLDALIGKVETVLPFSAMDKIMLRSSMFSTLTNTLIKKEQRIGVGFITSMAELALKAYKEQAKSTIYASTLGERWGSF